MDELLKRTFVAAERIGGIKVRQPLPADRTEVILIQRVVIREGGAAGATEEFGLQRFGQGEAGGAYGNTRKITERFLAKTAIVWKGKVKKVRSKGLEECQT